MKCFRFVAAACVLLSFLMMSAGPSYAKTEQTAKPRLVMMITIDQFRGDMPLRFRNRFDEGGFRYLMDHGTVYTQAHHVHGTTFTAVGHASLATGANPPQHGMAGNDWYDQQRGQMVYCVEDDRHFILGREPTPHEGTSPRNLLCSTFGDEMVVASGGRSRVFSVSLKDRGAILPGGHLGKAFWYDSQDGRFVTSSFYYSKYPEWVQKWNEAKPADRYRGKEWTLLNDVSTYQNGSLDDRACEVSYKQLGRTFPHPLTTTNPSDLYATLRFTPMGDELTLEFVEALVKNEDVGQRDATDVLAVSFSCTDYIGHAFGPHSLEAEDNVLRLDRTLADLFRFIDDEVGLDNTLIVLSSDHGICESPDYLSGLGLPAGRVDIPDFIETANASLKATFDVDVDLVECFHEPSIYLDLEAIKKNELDIDEVEDALAKHMLQVPGIAYAVTHHDLAAGVVTSSDPILAEVQRAFVPNRSGNVLIVQRPSWFLSDSDYAAMHGSPYSYDTYVPLMFAGPGVPAKFVERTVAPIDAAPTIAAYLDVRPPSGCVGTPLVEVLEGVPAK